jgi:DNA-binding beta-propeller fold protein YncE
MTLTRCAVALVGPGALVLFTISAHTPAADPPSFAVDPFWPKPLPNNWIIGQVSGVTVDAQDHVWIVHRPSSLTPTDTGAAQDPPISACCVPAPPVIEFDQEGNVVQAWGGPASSATWPASEHGIFVDHADNVWIGGTSHVVLKFTRDGKQLLQIGAFDSTGGSGDTRLLGSPADIAVDPETNEVYIADGYGNRRIIVFDAETGAYRRHWGAYGMPPDDLELAPYDPAAPPHDFFRSPVHAVRLSHDGRVYVADRVNNRIQVFRRDGAFLTEGFIARSTLSMGSVWDIAFSPDAAQTYMFVTDGTNDTVWILTREDLKIVGQFGRSGRYAGQFHWVHSVAVDSQGNLYATEVDTGQRVQRFVAH